MVPYDGPAETEIFAAIRCAIMYPAKLNLLRYRPLSRAGCSMVALLRYTAAHLKDTARASVVCRFT